MKGLLVLAVIASVAVAWFQYIGSCTHRVSQREQWVADARTDLRQSHAEHIKYLLELEKSPAFVGELVLKGLPTNDVGPLIDAYVAAASDAGTLVAERKRELAQLEQALAETLSECRESPPRKGPEAG